MKKTLVVGACLLACAMACAEEWAEARVRALERRAMEAVADLALVPPPLNVNPGPQYGEAQEVWAMNNGAALTPKGRLWASWIGGGDSPEAYTTCVFSDDNGETWSPPALVVDGHDPKHIPFPRSNIIANLWTDPAGKLHLFVSQSMWHNDGRMGVWETVCANPDDAKPAWSPIRRISDGAALNKPIVLRNGTWLLPVELPRTWGVWSGLFGTSDKDAGAIALASEDGGKTWTRRGGVTVPDSTWPENHFLELKDGTIRMYMRSRPGLRMAESRDEGRTWSAVTKPAGMDQPCARCQVRALASGNWIFVKHLSPPDSFNDNKRIGQIAYLSRDEGKTWEGGLVLDDRKSVTYPDVEQGPDGLIYVTHDFERGREAEIILHKFTEEDILAKKFQSPKSRQGIVVMKAMGTEHNRKKYAGRQIRPVQTFTPPVCTLTGGARLAPVADAEVAVCAEGVMLFNDRPFTMTAEAAKRLGGMAFLQGSIMGEIPVEVVKGGELFVATPTEEIGRHLSQGKALAALGFTKMEGKPFQMFGKKGCDVAEVWRKDMKAGEKLMLGKWALVCGFDPAGQPQPDPAQKAKEARILSYLRGTPSEKEAPRDILVNKPDYVVFVPKQPREKEKRDPAKPGDTYNDHFQVICNPSNQHLYAFWTQASREADIDQHIAFSKSVDKGVTWTPPVVLAGSPNKKNPELLASWQQPMLAKSGRLYCLWNQQTTSKGPHCGMMFGAFSDDDGDTWSAPKLVPFAERMDADPADDHVPPSWCNWQRPLRLGENGKYFVGCSRHGKAPYDERHGCKIEFWQFENIDENPLVQDIRIKYLCTNRHALSAKDLEKAGGFRASEPALEEAAPVRLPDGRLFAIMRSSVGSPVWVQSRDGGQTWSAPKILKDAEGKPYLHPRSPCPMYDWKGPEAASGKYFALVHQTFDFNEPKRNAYQHRGPLYLIAGEFDPNGEQPVKFKAPKLFAPRKGGNSFYTSYCILDGKGILWYNDTKFYLCGRVIGPEWFE